MDVTERDLHHLYTWIDDIPLSRPKRNFTRDFSDGVLMAEVMRYYFPKLVELHNYSSANGTRKKTYNWDTLNRRVFKRLGFQVPEEQVEAIVNCEPRAVESLLKTVREHVLHHQTMKTPSKQAPPPPARVPTPDCGNSRGFGYESGEDANNRLAVGRIGDGKKVRSVEDQRPASQIPRAPSQLSTTPPPEESVIRPKSSYDFYSSNEKDLMIKELRETNDLLLEKINKLEQLLNLKDRKIESLSHRVQAVNNVYSSVSPSP